MKIKPRSQDGGVMVELRAKESQIPVQPKGRAPVFRLQRILVPTDFSQCSRRGLQYAVSFARQFGAELHLLHVNPPSLGALELGPFEFGLADGALDGLEILRRSVGEEVRVRTWLRSGTPHEEITTVARELSVDLIVIATRSRPGFGRIFLGSTTDRVVLGAPCPVLIVREVERNFVAGSTTSLQQHN
jgi:universal stress protein A